MKKLIIFLFIIGILSSCHEKKTTNVVVCHGDSCSVVNPVDSHRVPVKPYDDPNLPVVQE